VLHRGEQHTDQGRVDPHIKLALDMLEKVAVIIEGRDDGASFSHPIVQVVPLVTDSPSRRNRAVLCGTYLSDSFTDPAPSRFGATEDASFALDSG